ncbi:hypothetical protein GCM10009757_23930 [Streptomyces cheonanensis]|uniref:Uncharacterized protein n=1 Tax=Streptomyces cheonanensis TaxID=312720 RepID=A0ABN2V4V3_9ACTN
MNSARGVEIRAPRRGRARPNGHRNPAPGLRRHHNRARSRACYGPDTARIPPASEEPQVSVIKNLSYI